MSVQRFSMVAKNHGEHFYCTMILDPNGAYVLNSDYDEIKAQLNHVSQTLFDTRMNVLQDKVLCAAFLETAKERLKKGES